MQRRHVLATGAALPFMALAHGAQASVPPFRFPSIDGGEYNLAAWRGQPVLVVNTASLCGFTYQYEALQTLHETLGPRGLVVLAIPSDDFSQELANEDEVAEFCDVHFGLTLPMTTIQSVRGDKAHPFYAWLRETEGFEPNWNFNKVLIDTDGRVVGTYGSSDAPNGPRMQRDIEAVLPV